MNMERPVPCPIGLLQGILGVVESFQPKTSERGGTYRRLDAFVTAWQTKEEYVCMPKVLAEHFVRVMRDSGNISDADKLEAILTGGWSYELKPTQEIPDSGGEVKVCDEAAAERWSIYKRPVQADSVGHHPAEWVADFALHEKRIAQIVVDNLNERSDT